MSVVAVSGIPVADGLFTWPAEQPQLVGARCVQCETVTFPAETNCVRCGAEQMERVLLSRRGFLFTWTTQAYRPKSPPYTGPDDFTPFAIGYIELPEGIRVEARLTEADPSKLQIGSMMDLCVVPLWEREDGTNVLTFAFAPVGAQA